MEIRDTQFGKAVLEVKAGTLKAPVVSQGNSEINYFNYQLAVHRHNLRIMSIGMKFKGITLTELKKYYSLKGRSAKDVCDDFLSKYNDLEKFIAENK